MQANVNRRTESPSQNLRGLVAVLLAFALALGTPLTAMADPVFLGKEAREFNEQIHGKPKAHDGAYGDGLTDGLSITDYDWDELENTPFDEDSGWARYLPEADPDNPYEELSGICQNAQVTFSALGTAAGAVPSPYAKGGSLVSGGVAAGFGFFSDWALEQDLLNAAAYGADYLLTDYLIKLYEDGKATWCFYDPDAEYTLVKKAQFPRPKQYGMGPADDLPAPGHEAEYKAEKVRKQYYERKYYLDNEVSTIRPWTNMKVEDFVVPDRTFKFRVEDRNATLFQKAFPETVPYDWDHVVGVHYENNADYGQYYLKPDPNEGAPAADPEASNMVCRYGYQIVDDVPFTTEQLSAIQALIYHYCSSQDWRMMIAEAKRRGIELNDEDFKRSIQYMMGFRLNDDWKNNIGFLLLDGLSLVNGKPYLSDGHKLAYKEELSEGILNMPWEEIADYSSKLFWKEDPEGAAADLTAWLTSKGYEYVVADGTAQLIVDIMRANKYDESVIEDMEGSVSAMWNVADIAVDEANYLHQRLTQASNRRKFGGEIHDAYVKRS